MFQCVDYLDGDDNIAQINATPRRDIRIATTRASNWILNYKIEQIKEQQAEYKVILWLYNVDLMWRHYMPVR